MYRNFLSLMAILLLVAMPAWSQEDLASYKYDRGEKPLVLDLELDPEDGEIVNESDLPFLFDIIFENGETAKDLGLDDGVGMLDYPPYSFCINVPWMSQVPPGDWIYTNNCGQAICVMLGGYFNHGAVAPWVIDQENRWLRCPLPNGCTTGEGTLQNLLWGFHGLHSSFYIGNQPDDVVMEGARGRPVIVGVRTGMQESGGRAHWMLFVGWDGSMYFHDPGRSKAEDGKFVRYSKEDFYRSWNHEGKKYIPVWK